MLSDKFLYPAFFRTIPSDKNQVTAIIQLLIYFNWTWIALLASDNDYGLEGMQSLYQQAPNYGICIAYQGIIPSLTDNTVQTMRNMVDGILKTKVNTIVVFSSKSKLRGFFPFVIEQNVTNKVWIGTEDWSAATLISGIPGIHTIGTVIGMSIKYSLIPGFDEFEKKVFLASMQQSDTQNISNSTTGQGNICLQSTDLFSLARKNFSMDTYDMTSAFSVYKAVYAVAHALHQALDCDSGECQKRSVYPWQVSRCKLVFLLKRKISQNQILSVTDPLFPLSSLPQLLSWLKQVDFSLDNTSVYFDSNGDPPTGYDIVSWVWRGTDWSVRVVGSFNPNPTMLTVNDDQIEWYDTGNSKPVRPAWSIFDFSDCKT